MGNRIPTVAVVDDKQSNRTLVRRSLIGVRACVREFPTVSGFLLEHSVPGTRLPDVLVLDFFLEDGNTGSALLAEMAKVSPGFRKKTKVVWYSSIMPCSMRLAKESGWIGLLKDKGAKYDPRLRSAVRRMLRPTAPTFLTK